MALLTVYRRSAQIIHSSPICSFAFLFRAIICLLTYIPPFFVAYFTGGKSSASAPEQFPSKMLLTPLEVYLQKPSKSDRRVIELFCFPLTCMHYPRVLAVREHLHRTASRALHPRRHGVPGWLPDSCCGCGKPRPLVEHLSSPCGPAAARVHRASTYGGEADQRFAHATHRGGRCMVQMHLCLLYGGTSL